MTLLSQDCAKLHYHFIKKYCNTYYKDEEMTYLCGPLVVIRMERLLQGGRRVRQMSQFSFLCPWRREDGDGETELFLVQMFEIVFKVLLECCREFVSLINPEV